jgi:hypothetical protein
MKLLPSLVQWTKRLPILHCHNTNFRQVTLITKNERILLYIYYVLHNALTCPTSCFLRSTGYIHVIYVHNSDPLKEYCRSTAVSQLQLIFEEMSYRSCTCYISGNIRLSSCNQQNNDVCNRKITKIPLHNNQWAILRRLKTTPETRYTRCLDLQ